MYDRSEAARRRILLSTDPGGRTAQAYRHLLGLLLLAPPGPGRDLALKQLADSCENAMGLVEKAGKRGDNRRGTPECDG